MRNPAVGLPPRDDISFKDYPGVFEDFDRDGILNVDDPRPLYPSYDTVEETKLLDSIAFLIDDRQKLIKSKDKVMDGLRFIAPSKGVVKGRVKSPYSIIGKLISKHLRDLTDRAGAKLIVDTGQEARDAGEAIRNGVLDHDGIFIKDYYILPKNGYRAYHFILYYGPQGDQLPVEVQVQTRRMMQIADAAHPLYKKKLHDAAEMGRLTEMASRADEGDKRAAAAIDRIIKDKKGLRDRLTRKK